MATITVVLADPPYGKQRPYTALRFSLAALNEGHQVNLFLLEDAVFAAKKEQQAEDMPNCEEMLQGAIQKGLRVKACTVCSVERGLKLEEVMEGVERSTMVDLVDWVVESDRTVFF
jgi:tRNA 2-thiouridine synthesizing protein D